MYFMADGREVIVIVCVLVLAGHAQKACDISMPDSTSLTVNCSRRDIRDVPDAWPKETEFIEKDGYVLITFFNNSITDVTQLAGVPGTRVAISFQANKIVDIVDDAFQNIPTLVYLDVSYNQLSGDVLRSEIFQGPYENGVYGYIALETLNLGYNKIHSLDRYLFQHTPNLTRLYLNNNPIEILDHVTLLALSTTTNLEVLDLASTEIESIPLDAFKSLSNLQQIDLSGNGFLTVPESLSFVGRTLKYLTFNNNPIAELNDDSFVGLANLIELEVGENENLEEVKRSTFTPLKSLKVLHLCHNANLRYISHNTFRGLKDNWTLKEVYLDDNHLSELSTDLMPWNKLDILGMSGNKWLCNCELYNIVSKQGAGTKFKSGDEPFCAAPMKLSGEYVTNVTLSYCPSFDTTFAKTKQHSRFKPKHVLWTILGVSMVVCVGMLIGLFVNTVKKYYKKKFIQPIRYANINDDSMIP